MVTSTAVIRHRVPLSPPDRKSVVNGSMTWDGAHGQASGLGERLLTVDDAVGGPVLNRVAPEVAHDGGISGLSPPPSRMRASPPRIPLKIAGIFALQPVIPSINPFRTLGNRLRRNPRPHPPLCWAFSGKTGKLGH